MADERTPDVLTAVDHERGVASLTLNRPAKLNALSDSLRSDLQDAVTALAGDNYVRVVVIRGEGRAFSAGADLRDRATPPDGPLGARRATGRWQRLLEDIERLPQVTVAQLHSHVIGGASLLAASCDFRVASTDVSIVVPELAIGIPLTWAGLPRLVREIGLPRTRDLVMTGRPLGGEEALAWGFIHRLVPPDELNATTEALVDELLAQPVDALAMTVDGMRALGRALSAPDVSWADPDLLRWSLRDSRGT